MSILATISLLVLGVILEANAEISMCFTSTPTHDRGNRRLENNDFNTLFVPDHNTNSFKVYIKAAGDVVLNFMSQGDGLPSLYSPDTRSGQIVLGGWNNQKSGAYCHSSDTWTEYPTPNILSADEEREFEIFWFQPYPDVFQVDVHDKNGLLFQHSFYDCVPRFTDIGYASAWGNDATWRFCFGCVNEISNCHQLLDKCSGNDWFSMDVQRGCQRSCNLCTAKRGQEEEKLSNKSDLLSRLLKESLNAVERTPPKGRQEE